MITHCGTMTTLHLRDHNVFTL